MIDFTSDASHVLLNPRLPAADRAALEALVVPLAAHVWIATSGTSGAMKLVALSKRALLTSAAAVNRHLESNAYDVWCCVLPTFHVGGLGIHARAFLSGARVETMPWDAPAFRELCELERVTLSALVPAQVSDLVNANLRAPASLRAIVIGGAAFAPELYTKARALGWPVLPSYGMSECCSQIATARGDDPSLVLLDHVFAREEEDGRLAFRSDALLTGYATFDRGFYDPKVAGWFVSEDRGSVEGRTLRVLGRAGEFVKIGGESVDLQRLDRILFEIAGNDAALVAMGDERLGHVLHVALASGEEAALVAAFNERVLPFERIRAVHRVAEIPRTALGKLRRNELAAIIAHRPHR
ncbi:MAG TPA: AMP-binding protein [Thermoanaerobaculia bacterium]|nr:AMP-binding protein [Thermoanaerobaculia bacterium]